MKGMTKLAMGATVAVTLSLTLLLFLLLATIFYSLFRPHRRDQESPNPNTPNQQEQQQQQQPRFPFYGHGVLRAPTALLLSIPNLESAASDHFVRISNPIYDATTTTTATNHSVCIKASSPSCLDLEPGDEKTGDGDGDGDGDGSSPPLRLMKKLAPVLPKTSVDSVETNRASSSNSSTSGSLGSSPSW